LQREKAIRTFSTHGISKINYKIFDD